MTGRCSRLRSETGQLLVLFALAIPVLMGMCAIIVDVGNVFVERRNMQKAADASALAGAQLLPSGGVACDAACQAAIATLTGQYKSTNLSDGTASALPQCGVNTPDCYEILPSTAAPVKVRVRLSKSVPVFFGGIFGKSNYTVGAHAAATKFGYTNVTPPVTVTIAGSTNPPVVNTVTVTTPGADVPALLFAKGTSCPPKAAINLNGAKAIFNGGVISNGGIDAPSNDMGGGPLIYANPPGCAPNTGNNGSWGTPIVQAPADWPVPPPFCQTATPTPGVNACNPTTAAQKKLITSVDGVPCTAAPDNWKITSPITAVGPGLLYCAKISIDVAADVKNVGFVAPTISVKGVVTSGTNLLPKYGGLLFYAYDGIAGKNGAPDTATSASVVDQTANGFSFSGAIYGPYGHVDLTASGATGLCPNVLSAGCGFIEADTIRLAGSGANFQGLGPGTPGPPTVSTTTTTTPGSTNPSTTTTTPGSTVTTGTGSNLDE